MWAAALFFLSALPGLGAPEWVILNDKLAHAGAYAVLGATLAWGHYRSEGRWSHGWFLLAGALYGVTDEFHQMFVPGRSPDPADLAADLVGVLLGYGTTRVILGRTKGSEDVAGPGLVDERDAS